MMLTWFSYRDIAFRLLLVSFYIITYIQLGENALLCYESIYVAR